MTKATAGTAPRHIVLGYERGEKTPRVHIDVDRLVGTRCLINANSGAGKSWTVRRLLEQSHGIVPHHVIDPEGEFHTLRDRYDYVLAGRPGGQKGDCPAEPKSAAMLARKLLELGVSAVIDLFELDPKDRARFVRLYLEAALDAPRALWRPTLIVIDEAHVFCPEKGEGEAESRDAVIGLMARGRKRGFGGVLATQRIAKLHKSAAAEANNVLIGRTALDVDLERAGRALGYDRATRAQLKRLAPGVFHASGPALALGYGQLPDGVIEVTVGKVDTRHPQAGQHQDVVAPPKDAIRQVLAELEALPAEAEAEARTVEALTARVAELERQLARRAPAAVDVQAAIDAAVKDHGARARALFRQETRTTIGTLEAAVLEAIRRVGNIAIGPHGPQDLAVDAAGRGRSRSAQVDQLVTDLSKARPVARIDLRAPEVQLAGAPGPTSPHRIRGTPRQRILDALAWFSALGIEEPGLAAVAFMSGYRPTSGTFHNVRGAARTAGLITYPGSGLTTLTASGRAVANPPAIEPSDKEVQAAVMAKLDVPCRRLLQALLPHGSTGLSNADLAAQAGYSAGSGTFANLRGRLRSLGLVDYPEPGRTCASSILYPEAA